MAEAAELIQKGIAQVVATSYARRTVVEGELGTSVQKDELSPAAVIFADGIEKTKRRVYIRDEDGKFAKTPNGKKMHIDLDVGASGKATPAKRGPAKKPQTSRFELPKADPKAKRNHQDAPETRARQRSRQHTPFAEGEDVTMQLVVEDYPTALRRLISQLRMGTGDHAPQGAPAGRKYTPATA